MAQSRKRIYVIMVRDDICPSPLAMKLGEIINLVLPNALYKAEGDDGYFVRETIHNIMAYDKAVLHTMGAQHVKPRVSQDPFLGWCECGLFPNLWQGGGCGGLCGVVGDFRGSSDHFREVSDNFRGGGKRRSFI